ncbi:hypothetical protein C2S52_019589 [Perilla frutescens var. hirtella]|nr:hypothetical protein C2S52_019589 [Perilla frutescens var. hirtella]
MAELETPTLPLSTMIHMVNIKLSSTSYLLWHAQIEPFLTSQNFMSLLDGSSPPHFAEITTAAGKNAPNPVYTKWYSCDQLLKLFLVSTLTEESISVVIGLAEYGRHFKALSDQLVAIGRPLDDSDKSHWFLRGLGSSFSSFTTAQFAQDPLPDFSTLLDRAQSHELFQKSLDDSPSSQAVFTAVNRGRGRGNSSNMGCWPSSTANLVEALSTSCSITPSNVSDWYLDTGASAHMTLDAAQLDNASSYSGNDHVTVGNVLFTDSQFHIQNQDTGQLLATGTHDRGLYLLESQARVFSAIL